MSGAHDIIKMEKETHGVSVQINAKSYACKGRKLSSVSPTWTIGNTLSFVVEELCDF